MDLVDRAVVFAAKAHEGQRRKYCNTPYISHCIEVMMLVHDHGGSDQMQAAALLHDTIEDCDTPPADIADQFDGYVAEMVLALSDLETGSRATRKRLSRDRLAAANGDVQTIKLADLISNSRSIIERDPDFAKVYLREKVALLRVMDKGDPRLWNMAAALIPDEYWSE